MQYAARRARDGWTEGFRRIDGIGLTSALSRLARCSCRPRLRRAPAWALRQVSSRRTRSTRAPARRGRRRIRQRTHRHDHRRDVGDGPLRRRALLRRHECLVGLPGLGTFYQTRRSRSRPGCRSRAQPRTTSGRRHAGPATAARCSGSTTSRPATSSRSAATVSSGYLDSGQNPIAGQWQHLAATFDGTTARFYIDGVEVAITAVLGLRRHLEHLAHRRLRQRRPAASSTASSTRFASTTAR